MTKDSKAPSSRAMKSSANPKAANAKAVGIKPSSSSKGKAVAKKLPPKMESFPMDKLADGTLAPKGNTVIFYFNIE